MFKQVEEELTTKQIHETFGTLQSIQTKDEVLGYIVMMNLKSLKQFNDESEDYRNGLLIKNAKEENGKLLKDKDGQLEFSRDQRTNLLKEQQAYDKEKRQVRLYQIPVDFNDSIKALPMLIKSRLIDIVFTISEPSFKDESK